MRKLIPILFGLGGFLLIAGIVAVTYGPGVSKKTPLDVNSTTHLSGEASKLNTTTGQLETNPVKAVSVTKTDSKHSDGSIVTWTNTSCLVIDTGNVPDCVKGDDPRLISASTDVFATDRKSGLAVSATKFLPSSATPHQGLQNKFPFDSGKQSYPYWDGTVGKAVPAKYESTKKVDGVDTYVYTSTIKDADIAIADGVPGKYDDVKKIYVEPKTGAILNQTDNQQRFLADGTKVLDLKLAFTAKQQKQSASDAKGNIRTLSLITTWIPIVGIVGGVLVLLVALFMLRSRRSQQTDGVPAGER
jgi:hypothetical protein